MVGQPPNLYDRASWGYAEVLVGECGIILGNALSTKWTFFFNPRFIGFKVARC